MKLGYGAPIQIKRGFLFQFRVSYFTIFDFKTKYYIYVILYIYMVEFYHLEKCLSEVLDRTKLHKTKDLEIYIFEVNLLRL